MSVDCIQSLSSPPLKRSRENVILPSGICSFKCGELLVTPSGDMWTFNCTVCSLSTSDIGVFICHIKLQHLNCQPITQELDKYEPTSVQPEIVHNVPPSPLPEPIAIIPNRNLFSNVEDVTSDVPKQLVMECSITKQEPLINDEEPLPSILVDSGNAYTKFSKLVRTESLTNDTQLEPNVSNKNPLNDNSRDLFTITSYNKLESGQDNKKIVQVSYIDDEKPQQDFAVNNVSITISDDDDEEIDYVELLSNDDEESLVEHNTEKNNIDDQGPGISSVVAFANQCVYKCKYCNKILKSKRGLIYHKTHMHKDKLSGYFPHKCEKCNKAFHSLQGMLMHQKTHDDNNYYQCPVCPSKTFVINLYLKHVMLHTSSTCFPCQVCAQIFPNNEDRLKHLTSHAIDLPYGCDVCFRRFRKSCHLIHHLKRHCIYNCQYCRVAFKAEQTIHKPYVCYKCERNPEIMHEAKSQVLSNSQDMESDKE